MTEFRFNIRKILFPLVLFLILPFGIKSQGIALVRVDSLARFALKDGIAYFSAPIRWKQNDWLKLGFITASTSIFCIFEEDLAHVVRQNQSEIVSDVSKYGLQPFGDSRLYRNYSVGLIAGTYLSGFILRDTKIQKTSLMATEALILSSALTGIIKGLTGRHRPNQSKENSLIFSGPNTGDFTSFPSGHTSAAWAIATVFAKSYSDKNWVAPLSYSMAGLVSLSRIYDQKHWASDVFFGAVIGYYTGKFVCTKNKNRILIYPKTINRQPGFGLSYTLL